MNGCLFKTLLIMTALVALFLGYPYLKQYASNSMQGEMNSLETQLDFVKKFGKQIIRKEIDKQKKEIEKDNSGDSSTNNSSK